jgi:pimeloyl-ACP methyl ester carboxylesterase
MRAGRFEALDRVPVPVTLVWPDHDRLISRPVSVPERIRNVVLEDAGHIPMWDAPERLVETLLEGSLKDSA